MAIQIIVEDGTGKDDSNSYVSVAALIIYAAQQGVTLTDSDETAILLIKSMLYVESKNYKGKRSTLNQALSWPRKDAYIYPDEPEMIFPIDSIPKSLKIVQMEVALVINDGIDLFPTITASDMVVSETVGPISTTYANPAEYGLSYMPHLPLIDTLIKCLLVSKGGSFRTTRGGYG